MNLAVENLIIDWAALLDELHGLGQGTYRISEQINIPRSTLDYYRTGRWPRHADGERLLMFWCATTGKSRSQAPTCKDIPRVYRNR